MRRSVSLSLACSAALLLVPAATSGQDAEAPSGPSWFTGTSTGAPIVFDPTTEYEPGVWMDARDGEVHGITVETSDARFGGEWSYTFHEDEWPVSLGDREEIVAVERHSIRLTNDEGSWAGTGTLVQHYLGEDGEFVDGASDALHVLEGEGAYDGLTAYVLFDFMTETGGPDIRGVILPEPPTDFPTLPTPSETRD